jgi:hypothetical protein
MPFVIDKVPRDGRVPFAGFGNLAHDFEEPSAQLDLPGSAIGLLGDPSMAVATTSFVGSGKLAVNIRGNVIASS